jgi:aromatic-L-amino-acid decarboxylase
MVWRTFGRAGIAARIRDHMRLAQLFTDWVNEDPRFELAAPTVMGVVCFRFIAADETINGRLVEKINAAGETYLCRLNSAAAPSCGWASAISSPPRIICVASGRSSKTAAAV